MSDSFLFQSAKNKWQLLIFGVSITDARNYAKCTHPNYDMKFIGKNPGKLPEWVCCATTEKQVKLNREI